MPERNTEHFSKQKHVLPENELDFSKHCDGYLVLQQNGVIQTILKALLINTYLDNIA